MLLAPVLEAPVLEAPVLEAPVPEDTSTGAPSISAHSNSPFGIGALSTVLLAPVL